MLDLPTPIIQVLRHLEPVFSERIWAWAQVLLVGAILTPGSRTVTAALRVMGLSGEAQYQNYHRVLNRAVWCSRSLSERLLRQVIASFVPADAPLVLGLDDHIERRRGKQIAAKGNLPGCGTLEPKLFRQDKRLALGVDDGVGKDSVGRARVGVALFDGVGALGAVLSGAQRAPRHAA
jgi:hypothetical protein